MALPVGVSTCAVTISAPVTFSGVGAAGTVRITPSQTVIHVASGIPLVNFLEEIDLTVGVQSTINLPHVDQAGFVDEHGDAITGWYYTAVIHYASTSITLPKVTKVFQVSVGLATLDLDLVPIEEPVPDAVTVEVPPVTSVNGMTGAVLVPPLTPYVQSVNGMSGVLTLPVKPSGWASYTDTQYTQASPHTILEDQTWTLTNNALIKLDGQKPSDVSTLWDSTTNKIVPPTPDCSFNAYIRVAARSPQTDAYLEFGIDVGGAIGLVLQQSIVLVRGPSIWKQYTINVSGWMSQTFFDNGGAIKLIARRQVIDIAEIQIFVNIIHRPQT